MTWWIVRQPGRSKVRVTNMQPDPADVVVGPMDSYHAALEAAIDAQETIEEQEGRDAVARDTWTGLVVVLVFSLVAGAAWILATGRV